MTDGELRVDPDGLRAAQPGVETLGDLVHAALARLTVALDAEGPCWGDDETGHAFGDAYRPAERELRAAFTRTATHLHDVGAAITVVADVLQTTDDRARERLS
jgi:hypothetical protein